LFHNSDSENQELSLIYQLVYDKHKHSKNYQKLLQLKNRESEKL